MPACVICWLTAAKLDLTFRKLTLEGVTNSCVKLQNAGIHVVSKMAKQSVIAKTGVNQKQIMFVAMMDRPISTNAG